MHAGPESLEPNPIATATLCKKGQNFVVKHLLVIGLIIFVFVPLWLPQPGTFLHDAFPDSFSFTDLCVVVIFIIAGLQLNTPTLLQSLRWKAIWFSLPVIVIVLPFLASAAVALNIPTTHLPAEFLLALAIFLNAPSTASVCVIMTAQSHGNMALALLLTVTTNVIMVFTIPFVLPLTLFPLRSSSKVSVDSIELLLTLVYTILIPFIASKVIHDCSSTVRRLVHAHPVTLRAINTIAIVFIPWIQISPQVDQLKQLSGLAIVISILLFTVAHIFYWIFTWTGSGILRIQFPDRIAVMYTASESAVAPALSIIASIGASFGSTALLSLGMVIYFVTQLFLDAILASYFSLLYDKKPWIVNKTDTNEDTTAENNETFATFKDHLLDADFSGSSDIRRTPAHKTSSFNVETDNHSKS